MASYHLQLECNEDLMADRGSQKLPPFDPLGKTPECIASDTICIISPKQSPKVCLNDVGALLASRQSSAAAASTCAAYHPTFIPAPEPSLQRSRPSRRSRNFLEAVTDFLSPPPGYSGSVTSRPIWTSSPGLRDYPLRSGNTGLAREVTRGDEDQTENGTIEQKRMQFNDPGGLLNRDRRQQTLQ